ncbi:MAG: cold shock domain-containing protein [Vicinamibacterales bacterium]
MAVLTGIIARLLLDKGFGFIRTSDDLEYFFHRSALPPGALFEQLREGQAVTFHVGDSAKGPRAELVFVS